MECPTRGAWKVGIRFATIVLYEGNRHVRGTCACNETREASEDCGAVMHRQRRLKLIHLGINNKQHGARIALKAPEPLSNQQEAENNK